MNNKLEPKNVDGVYRCPKCDNELDITEEDIECFCITPEFCKDCGTELNWEKEEQRIRG